ncbi:uncharacterized protein LOC129750635 [Uranotaenia lowii]|uniref:uncharacterized protein LOC129750635 n=1 Tax=Uranotaenia lowii TaxID=190385 RepID=UPI00247B25B3|nr:uncharacterized protein LOC129750635 [Uranotaenia lowii]
MGIITWTLLAVALGHVATGSGAAEDGTGTALTDSGRPKCSFEELWDAVEEFLEQIKDMFGSGEISVDLGDLMEDLNDYLEQLTGKSNKMEAAVNRNIVRRKRQDSNGTSGSKWWDSLKAFVVITIEKIQEIFSKLFATRKRRALDQFAYGIQLEQQMEQVVIPRLQMLKLTAPEGKSAEMIVQQLRKALGDFRMNFRAVLSKFQEKRCKIF